MLNACFLKAPGLQAKSSMLQYVILLKKIEDLWHKQEANKEWQHKFLSPSWGRDKSHCYDSSTNMEV